MLSRAAKKEAGEAATSSLVAASDLEGLPASVQKWLQRANIVGKPRISTVYLKQKGVIRTREDQPWMPFEAVQYYVIDEPAYIWSARVKAASLIWLVGRDRYLDGKGNMLIKLLGLKTVADGKGKEIDQGTLLRFLSEIMWFPSAALSEYIRWEPVDGSSARAIMSYKGTTASGIFFFDKEGDVTRFTAQRYQANDDGYSLQNWSGSVLDADYRECSGLRIPAKAEGTWHLETGDFSYFRGEIMEFLINPTA